MTHGLHTAGVTGFLHAHHVAALVAATAVVGGGAALGAAWHSSQPASTPMAKHGQTSQQTVRTAGQINQWMGHHHAYHGQLAWLRRHGDYRSDRAQSTVMHGRWMWIGHAHAYQTQAGWLRHHGYRDHGWMAHYRGYRHELNWMIGHGAYAYGHMPHGYRAFQARMHWLRDHRDWNTARMRHSTWYHHNHDGMGDHMSGDRSTNHAGAGH